MAGWMCGRQAPAGLWLAVAGLLAPGLAGPAQAQAIAVMPEVDSSIETRAGVESFTGTSLVAYREGTRFDGGGFEASVDVAPDSIFFRNGALSLGAIGVIASATRLDVLLTNDTAAPLLFRSIESVIIPAGFGFYNAVVAGACSPLSPTACGSIAGPGTGFSALVRPAEAGVGDLLGRVGFAFEVQVDGIAQFALGSSLALVHDPVFGANRFVESFGDGPSLLAGWRQTSAPGDGAVIGYAFDTTRVTVDLGGQLIAPGETRTVTFLSLVFAETHAIIPSGGNPLALLGYAAFGDPPIGRPGGGGSLAGIEIGGLRFAPPSFVLDRLVFPVVGGGGVIPEPATWAMLIAGFGLVGGVARRRGLRLA